MNYEGKNGHYNMDTYPPTYVPPVCAPPDVYARLASAEARIAELEKKQK